MAPHSSTLAWKIPWTEEPGGLQSMGSLGVRHDWATSLSLFTFTHWRRKWQPTPVFLLLSMGSHRVGHDWSDLAAAAAAVYICQCYSPYYFDYSIRITVYNHHSSCWSSHTVLILIEVSKLELERTYNFLDLSSLALSLIRIFSLGLPVFIRTTFPNQA